MDFLYKIFENPFARRELAKVDIPNFVSDNLKLEIRAYQEAAFKRFFLLHSEDIDGKPKKPFHLLFNMATGSGKTMVMAGLMLYLYEEGYRNFLFFVNSGNIISKTKDNFLNAASSKYLFSNKIMVHGKEVLIKEVGNFDEADAHNINIKFTTIQQLHSDLNKPKENSVTFDDFQNKKVCLIADEAHHLSSGTKSGVLFGSWESTVLAILQQSEDNLLLEFTATLDYDSREIIKKYSDKVLYKYDLRAFREDKYSKEINLIRSYYDEDERIIQALILNTYRQELAIKNNINLKPVIFFKAKKTIAESEQNKVNFHKLIDNLNLIQLENIRDSSKVAVVKKAFEFFEREGISSDLLTKKIKNNFKAENCLSANESESSDKKKQEEGRRSDELLNTLEESRNPIRAIFAVQKLNEGWDVLNLFDIVRLYEGQNTGGSNTKVGATTVSEAQLIGRGARYFPFQLNEDQDKYKRKFDGQIPQNDLQILEELYYHTQEDSRYISELKKALIETGIIDDEYKVETKSLELKPAFKETDFYKNGKVFFNKKVEKNFHKINSFNDLGVKNRNFRFNLSSGSGGMTNVFEEEKTAIEPSAQHKERDIKIAAIPIHIVQFAIAQNPFFHYENIIAYFPNIASIANFIQSEDYLASLEITFIGNSERIKNINHKNYLKAIQNLLKTIEAELKTEITLYEGSNFIDAYIHDVFVNKKLNIPKNDVRANGQEEVVANEPWYAYNANYGTDQEKSFVALFARKFDDLQKNFDDIYLIRNERAIKIFDKQGRAFEPDFVLFCKQKEGDAITYQVFIEPKGLHLKMYDKWKETFLKDLSAQKETFTIHSDKYLITGVPFYNSQSQNDFYEQLEKVLVE